MTEWNELVQSEVSRRAFLTRMSAAGLGTAAAALLAGCGSSNRTIPVGNVVPTPVPTPTPTPVATPTPVPMFDPTNFPTIVGRSEDEVVLNFALTLEIAEADLYRQALNLASGRPLTTALDTTVPASGSTAGYTQKVSNGTIPSTLAPAGFLYLVQYSYVEAAHRDFLTTVLQSIGAPVAVANPKGYTTTLPSTATLSDILSLLYNVEEEGTRAYLGAAGNITNKTYLTAAAAIYSTECRHSSALAYIVGKDTGPIYNAGDYNVVDNTQTTNPTPAGDPSTDTDNTFQFYRKPTQVLTDVQPFFVK